MTSNSAVMVDISCTRRSELWEEVALISSFISVQRDVSNHLTPVEESKTERLLEASLVRHHQATQQRKGKGFEPS